MYSREDVVKMLISKKGVDVGAPGGVSIIMLPWVPLNITERLLTADFSQPKLQSAVHLVASRQTGTATSILRVLLNIGGKEIRLKPDGVSIPNRG